MRIRAVIVSLVVSSFLLSCTEAYLFVSDTGFGEMERSRIHEFSSRPMILEVFSRKPSPREVLAAAEKNRTELLVFSPLYHDLAESVLREDPDLSVYAVLPPGSRKPAGIRAVELDARGAADRIVTFLETQFPGDEPVHLTLLKIPQETLWDSLVGSIGTGDGRFRLKQIQIPPETLKQRDFGAMTAERTDVLLLFLGEYSPGLAREPDPDSRGLLPELIISDRPVDPGGNISSRTLAVDWVRVYKALLDGSEAANPWILLPEGGTK